MPDVPRILVCREISNLPTPIVPSMRRSCNQCGIDIWLSFDAQTQIISNHPETLLFCEKCATRIKSAEFRWTQDQKDAFEKKLGRRVSNEEMQKVMHGFFEAIKSELKKP